jgi:tetratricopeptide (TPR) repeat protein
MFFFLPGTTLSDRTSTPAFRPSIPRSGLGTAALNNLALLNRADGDLTRALELTEDELVLAVTVGDRHREAALLNNAADLLQAAGRHDEAMERLESAVAIFAEIGEQGAMEPEIWKLVDW